RGRSRIVIYLIGVSAAIVESFVVVRKCKRSHRAPFGRKKFCDVSWKDVTVLIDNGVERERLPPVGINDPRIAGKSYDKRRISRLVMLIRIAIQFIRSVLQSVGDQLFSDIIPERGRRLRRIVGRCVGYIVSEGVHERVETRE